MWWFCPYCWERVEEGMNICPNCCLDLTKFNSLDFEEKLILGLKNPNTQNRMFVIEILGKIKSIKAVPVLCHMLLEERDIFELIEIAKALISIDDQRAFECLEIAEFRHKDKIILTKYIKKAFKK